MEQARHYVTQNLHRRIRLKEVAKEIHLSPSYFSMLFKKEYGQSFIDYVNEAKMKEAKILLQDKNRRIGEVSELLGFENAYYFSRVFRRYVGMSPTEYLKQ